jgi:hypothetical protein
MLYINTMSSLGPGLYVVVVFVVLLSGAMWLFLGAFMSEFPFMLRLVMVIVGVLALIIMPNRDMYLPFLGETALPASVLQDTVPRGNVILALDNLPPNSKVIFWAANEAPPHSIQGPSEAYDNSLNGGIATASEEGVAHVTLYCPQQYKVSRLGIDKVLPRHIHFRYEVPWKKGMFSSVQTLQVADVCG